MLDLSADVVERAMIIADRMVDDKSNGYWKLTESKDINKFVWTGYVSGRSNCLYVEGKLICTLPHQNVDGTLQALKSAGIKDIEVRDT